MAARTSTAAKHDEAAVKLAVENALDAYKKRVDRVLRDYEGCYLEGEELSDIRRELEIARPGSLRVVWEIEFENLDAGIEMVTNGEALEAALKSVPGVKQVDYQDYEEV